MKAPFPHLRPVAEIGMEVVFGAEPTPQVRAGVLALHRQLTAAPFGGFQEAVPGYTTLTVYADPCLWSAAALDTELRLRLSGHQEAAGPFAAAKTHVFPVCYGGALGPDLDHVARATGLDPAEVIARHSAATYHVDLVGFVPGFGYLSGLDPALRVPRHTTPRVRVSAGSVALAGLQSAVYPFSMPGGWQIIGRTSAVLWQPTAASPSVFRAGDRVRFESVGVQQHEAGLPSRVT